MYKYKFVIVLTVKNFNILYQVCMNDTWLKLTFQQVSIDFIQCISVSIYTYICMTFGHVLKLIVEAVFH